MRKYIQIPLVVLSLYIFPVGVNAKTLVFSAIPDIGTGSIEDKYGVFLEYLEKKTGYKIRFIPVQSYAALLIGMRSKQIDFSYSGPKLYIEAVKRNNAKPLAAELNLQGKKGYKSVIITHADTNYTSIADLKGKTFAFVDLNSTSGGIIPTLFFKKNNIVPKTYFSNVLYTGSHEAAIMSIRTKKIDAAVTNDLDLEELIRAKRIARNAVRIVWQSRAIPSSIFMAAGHIEAPVRSILQQAIVSFNNKEVFKKLSIGGYVVATDADYDALREVMAVKTK